ncbi:MAG TPA: AAA family ATPase, partial [Candidatus Pygmaiobacter gallistercoris]|nr:AAA family ATPase [Candidatus Pygmaiobacter gallistercoris]
MILTEHTVRNYRNIEEAHFCPSPGLTVLCGRNGQGKTNLLESIWLLSGAKSFRGSRDVQLVRRGEPYAVIESAARREDDRRE